MENKTVDELLLQVREDIDCIDRQLLPLFIERMKCAERVAEIKRGAGLPVLNAAREQVILDRVREAAGEYGDSAEAFYRAVMAISRERQHVLLQGGSALQTRDGDISFVPVESAEQIALVAKTAEPIWFETYEPIIGRDAVLYMLEKFQSEKAINRQLAEEGYVYYLICADGETAGFIGLVPHKEGKMFLSKLYISRRFRGQGIVKKAFAFIAERCRAEGLDKIYLTVNKQNAHAIEVYKHHGFYEIDAVVSDIGCGYVMDDYILQKDI